MRLYEILEGSQATVYTHPDTLGADVIQTNTGLSDQIKYLPLSKLIANEPESKMKQAGSKQAFKKLIGLIKSGVEIPPITVTNHPSMPGLYLILDGHHRFFAAKVAGGQSHKSRDYTGKECKNNC